MPWECKKHKPPITIPGKQTDKKPSCDTCGKNTFVHWESATVEFADTLMRTGATYNVYIETHQGKHVMGGWPGYTGVVGGSYTTFAQGQGHTRTDDWPAPAVVGCSGGDGHPQHGK